jgi:hypothetical protein
LRRLGELLNPFRLPARDDLLGAVAEWWPAHRHPFPRRPRRRPITDAPAEIKSCPLRAHSRSARRHCAMQRSRRWFRGQTT